MRHLEELYHKFLIESSIIEVCYKTYLKRKEQNVCSYPNSLVDGLVVRLHDAWVRLCRELIIRSAAQEPMSLTGMRVIKAPGIHTRADVIPKLSVIYPPIGRTRPPYWEPRWGDITECLRAASVLRLSNYLQISAGLGMPGSPIDDLRLLRNYIAHRRADTARKLAPIFHKYRIPIIHQVYSIPAHPVTGGIPLFAQWIGQMQVMAEIALQ